MLQVKYIFLYKSQGVDIWLPPRTDSPFGQMDARSYQEIDVILRLSSDLTLGRSSRTIYSQNSSPVTIMAMLGAVLVILGSTLTLVPWAKACETLPSNLHIIKEIYGQGGQLERTCEGEVAVTKCEGTCHSKVRPSAISHSGFLKDCQCCRETSLRHRDVLLNKCYDPNGIALRGDKETYVISLREPTDCKCYKCGDTTVL